MLSSFKAILMHDTLPAILILLTSSVLAVALFRALRLPAMLAYFLVGLALGPHTFGILPDTEANRELAEFGIVFLMFSIGLEFSLAQLYAMRKTVLGLGGMQVLLTMLAVSGGAGAHAVEDAVADGAGVVWRVGHEQHRDSGQADDRAW